MAGLRLVNILTEAEAAFFYKTTTITMVNDEVRSPTLEFPASFVSDHFEEFGEDVALERRTCGTVWWLRLKVWRYSYRKCRVYTHGDGWRTFVLENGITVGDLLVFELVELSRFLVHVYPPDASVTPYRYMNHRLGNARLSGEEEESELLNSRNVDEDMSQGRPTRPSSPSDKVALETCFTKILSASHVAGGKPELSIPMQFCRSHGLDKFDRKLFTLEGPRKKCQVKAFFLRSQRRTKFRFAGQGWKSFCIANSLKVGDMVSFTLTGPACFAVSVA